MRIFIDIDDTISNFGEILLQNLNKKHNTNYSYYDINSWNWIPEKFEEPWSVLTPQFWEEVKINSEAKNFIAERIRHKDEIFLATATFIDEALPVKIDSTLKQLNGLIDKNHVIITHNKNILCGDVMIDDAIHHLINNNCKWNICIAKPWNYTSQKILDDNNILRTMDWGYINNYLNYISYHNNFKK